MRGVERTVRQRGLVTPAAGHPTTLSAVMRHDRIGGVHVSRGGRGGERGSARTCDQHLRHEVRADKFKQPSHALETRKYVSEDWSPPRPVTQALEKFSL